jgi:hypothetical protein
MTGTYVQREEERERGLFEGRNRILSEGGRRKTEIVIDVR